MNALVVFGLILLIGLVAYGLIFEERRLKARKGKLREAKPIWMVEDDVVELDLGLDDD